ncbi:MAG TPA: hypothetical protein VFU47_08195, partial [Armatimonadota bacterium]|nr:hypothetical protein [Armatimonadota bacterium]
LLGALLGAVSPNAEEAHWRVTCLVALLPLALAAGLLRGFTLAPITAVSPLFAAILGAQTGAAGPGAWAGTLLYAAAGGVAASLLATRLRALVAPA